MDQLKDGRIGADAERERAHRDYREDGAATQHAQRIPKITAAVVHDGRAAPVAAGFLLLFRAAKRPQRGRSDLPRRHAVAEVELDLVLDVIPQLFVEFTLDARATEE